MPSFNRMRAIGFFAGMSPELPSYRTTELPNYRTTARLRQGYGGSYRGSNRPGHILEDKGMRYRLLPFRPLGWIALALGLLLSPTPARATESLGGDAPSQAEHTSAEGRAPAPSRVNLDHHRQLAPFALYSLRVASHDASDASESSGKDDVAVGAVPGRVPAPATTCAAIQVVVARAVATRRASSIGPAMRAS